MKYQIALRTIGTVVVLVLLWSNSTIVYAQERGAFLLNLLQQVEELRREMQSLRNENEHLKHSIEQLEKRYQPLPTVTPSPDVPSTVRRTLPDIEITEPLLTPATVETTVPDHSLPEPVMEEVGPEPVMEEAEPEPVVEEAEPEPAMEEVGPEPAMEEIRPEPAMEEIGPEPAMEEAEPEPVVEEIGPELPIKPAPPQRKRSTPKPIIVEEPATKEEKQAYAKVVAYLNRGEFEQLETALMDFLLQYSSGAYAASAHYLLGELRHEEDRHEEALKSFSRIVDQFPNSEKLDAARLKMAYIYYAQREWDLARKLLKSLINSDDKKIARLAKKRLDRMTQEKR